MKIKLIIENSIELIALGLLSALIIVLALPVFSDIFDGGRTSGSNTPKIEKN